MTGEMSTCDITEGGEHYAWAQDVRQAAQDIARRSQWAVKLKEVRPFDVYQGPYADMTIGRLWSGETEDDWCFEFYLRGKQQYIQGTTKHIASELRALAKKPRSRQ